MNNLGIVVSNHPVDPMMIGVIYFLLATIVLERLLMNSAMILVLTHRFPKLNKYFTDLYTSKWYNHTIRDLKFYAKIAIILILITHKACLGTWVLPILLF